MDYRVFDVASVSSITPFVYASHYRGFFVGACGTSLGATRLGQPPPPVAFRLFTSAATPFMCLGSEGKANQSSQCRSWCGLLRYSAPLQAAAQREELLHTGRITLHPSAFWYYFATSGGTLHTTCLWYRGAIFGAILI